MAVKRYMELFRVNLRHTFYRGGLARDLELTPFAATLALARRHDIRWTQRGPVLEVYYGAEAQRQAPLDLLAGPTSLYFMLRCTHPYFQNITDLPELGPGSILYGSNTGAFSLTRGAFAGAADLLPVRGPVFGMDPQGGDILGLLDSRGRKLAAVDPGSDNALDVLRVQQRDDGSVDVVLPSWLEAGHYALDRGQAPPYRFLYGHREVQPGDLAVIEIRLGVKGRPEVPEGATEVPQFELAFQALSTNWRWHLLPQTLTEIDPAGIEILDQRSARALAIEVGKQPEPLRSGNGNSLRVWLKEPLALRETPELMPQLRLPGGGNGKNGGMQLTRLPTPDPYRNLVIEQERTRMYSDMYVYL